MIETGGTFATEVKESGFRGLSENSVFNYGTVRNRVDELGMEFICERPLRLLSENMTVPRLESLLRYLKTVDFSLWDGIILTHGTDTLAYSVDLIALALGSVSVPFVFVSADRPLADPKSNGIDNFIAALDMIASGELGVYAVFRGGDGTVYVHRGGRLRQMDNIHNGFYSQGCVAFGFMRNHRFCYNEHPLNLRHQPVCGPFNGDSLSKRVLQIHPYPGLDYSCISLDGVDAVLHWTYHSGTYCSDGGPENLDVLLEKTGERIPVIIAGGTSEGERYEDLLRFRDRLVFADDTAPEAVYAKLLLACGNPGICDPVSFLKENRIGEIVRG